MLPTSAIPRVIATLVVAAVLAALWQSLPPWSGASTAPQAPVTRPQPLPAPPATAPTPILPRNPPPAPVVPVPPAAATPVPAAPAPAASKVPDMTAAPPIASPAPATRAVPPPSTPADPPVPAPPSADAGTEGLREGTPAAADTRPVAVDLVDLNTASVQQLNALRGGGLIGRAVVRGRPYGSVDELLTKRILSRSAYERIRDQVTVR